MPDIAKTIEKVRSFSELEEGWHFGEGRAALPELQIEAINLLREADYLGISRANAFPGVNGEVQVTLHHEDRMLELTLETDGSITIAEDKGKEQVSFIENNSKADAISKIEEFGQTLWDISEPYTASFTTQKAESSAASLSSLLAIEASRSLRKNVRSLLAEPSVGTLLSIIPVKSAIPLSTGRFRVMFYRKAVTSSKSQVQQETSAITTFLSGVRGHQGLLSKG